MFHDKSSEYPMLLSNVFTCTCLETLLWSLVEMCDSEPTLGFTCPCD